ncbi:glycosyltransferase family 2 protein [Bernardetia sp.]|uniref:glycosyltransferase family 2 protein n=1 Tax=Bernardetia sp. TaxID=1937974 RepID=UPI0025C67091|nr:glycosyltransferase family 2 protein [Bernardetia sp.]
MKKIQFTTLTVATVCYNAAEALEKTIQNVAAQTYPNIEYLVIDGNSTDNTLEIIKKYENDISTWISEKDNGIYDAMNKAIKLAKGDYILFMNAGDTFSKDTIIEAIFLEIYQKFDKKKDFPNLIYGDYTVINQTFAETVQAESLEKPWMGMKFCHQSMLLKTELAKKQPFSGKYITSDFEQVYELYQKGISFYYFPKPIANFQADGLSSKNKIKVRFESKEIVNKHDKSLKTNLAFWKLILWTYFVETVRKILPTSFFESLEKTKTKVLGGRKKVSN